MKQTTPALMNHAPVWKCNMISPQREVIYATTIGVIKADTRSLDYGSSTHLMLGDGGALYWGEGIVLKVGMHGPCF